MPTLMRGNNILDYYFLRNSGLVSDNNIGLKFDTSDHRYFEETVTKEIFELHRKGN